jgi:hypothetical protein
MNLTAHVAGVAEAIEACRGVKYGVGNRVIKAAIRKQATKVLKVAKSSLAGVARTGLLQKSLGVVYRKPRKGDTGGVYVVGPRRRFATYIGAVEGKAKRLFRRITGRKAPKAVKLAKRIVNKFRGLKVSPARYAHIVEKGRPEVRPKNARVMSDGRVIYGTRARAVKAHPYMRPAAAALKSGGMAGVTADIKAGISREAAKYAAKGKTIYGAGGGK